MLCPKISTSQKKLAPTSWHGRRVFATMVIFSGLILFFGILITISLTRIFILARVRNLLIALFVCIFSYQADNVSQFEPRAGLHNWDFCSRHFLPSLHCYLGCNILPHQHRSVIVLNQTNLINSGRGEFIKITKSLLNQRMFENGMQKLKDM